MYRCDVARTQGWRSEVGRCGVDNDTLAPQRSGDGKKTAGIVP
jgi:hypothetical protein